MRSDLKSFRVVDCIDETSANGSLKVRILILEDDPFIALDLQAIVEGQGHEIVGVFDTLAEARSISAMGSTSLCSISM